MNSLSILFQLIKADIIFLVRYRSPSICLFIGVYYVLLFKSNLLSFYYGIGLLFLMMLPPGLFRMDSISIKQKGKELSDFRKTRPVPEKLIDAKRWILFVLSLIVIFFVTWLVTASFHVTVHLFLYVLCLDFVLIFFECGKLTKRFPSLSILLFFAVFLGTIMVAELLPENHDFLSAGEAVTTYSIRWILVVIGMFSGFVIFRNQKLIYRCGILFLCLGVAVFPKTFGLNFLTEVMTSDNPEIVILTDGLNVKSITIDGKEEDMGMADIAITNGALSQKKEDLFRYSDYRGGIIKRIANVFCFNEGGLFGSQMRSGFYGLSESQVELFMKKRGFTRTQDFLARDQGSYGPPIRYETLVSEPERYFITEFLNRNVFSESKLSGEFVLLKSKMTEVYSVPLSEEDFQKIDGMSVRAHFSYSTMEGYEHGVCEVSLEEVVPYLHFDKSAYSIPDYYIILNPKRKEYMFFHQRDSRFSSARIKRLETKVFQINSNASMKNWIDNAVIVKYRFEEVAVGKRSFTLGVDSENKTLKFSGEGIRQENVPGE